MHKNTVPVPDITGELSFIRRRFGMPPEKNSGVQIQVLVVDMTANPFDRLFSSKSLKRQGRIDQIIQEETEWLFPLVQKK